MKRIDQYWNHHNWVSVLLLPLMGLFCGLVWWRRRVYAWGWVTIYRPPVPVVVVGNISVGGTGKTPLVVALVNWLKRSGYYPGVISRGYRGQATHWPQSVQADSDPTLVGDEAVLLASRCHCPIMVGPERSTSIQALLEAHPCDVIISDDGLQHYRMGRAIEIAVIDGVRRFGNGLCLPAGPLREPISRLKTVDFIIGNGVARKGESLMTLQSLSCHQVADPGQTRAVSTFAGKQVHAVAGIGHPERFFHHLEKQGMSIVPHAFPDHHHFIEDDLQFNDALPVIMTEKDAVKCRDFANSQHWYLSIDGILDAKFYEQFSNLLDRHMHG